MNSSARSCAFNAWPGAENPGGAPPLPSAMNPSSHQGLYVQGIPSRRFREQAFDPGDQILMGCSRGRMPSANGARIHECRMGIRVSFGVGPTCLR